MLVGDRRGPLGLLGLSVGLVACVRLPHGGPCGDEAGYRYLGCKEGTSAVLGTGRTVTLPEETDDRIPDGYVVYELPSDEATGGERRGLFALRSAAASMQVTDRYAVLGLRARSGGLVFLGEFLEVPVGLVAVVIVWPGMIASVRRTRENVRLQQPGVTVVRSHFARGYAMNWSSLALMLVDPSVGILTGNFTSKFSYASSDVLADGPSEATTLRSPVAGACVRVAGEVGEVELTTDGSGHVALPPEAWPVRRVTTCDGAELSVVELDIHQPPRTTADEATPDDAALVP